MLKRTLTISLVATMAAPLQGCFVSAMQTVQTYNNVRSGYQAYQGVSAIKDLDKAAPILRTSDILYVKVDLNAAESSDMVNGAAASQICTRFAEEFSSIKAHDLNRTRELQCVSSGEVPAGAVVLNLRELVEENRAMRLIQSDTIKSETSFVERETGAILATQANPGFKTHEELIGFVGGSLTAQLLRSLAPAPNDPEYETWAKKVEEWNKAKMDMAANT